MKKRNIIVLHGPNLNMTGVREKGIYGEESFENINRQIIAYGRNIMLECEIFHSNYEGKLIDKIQSAKEFFEGGVINAGALSHYSYCLRDAISSVRLPFVEAYMTNVYARDEFRKNSVIAEVCVGQISGFGKHSYFLALQALKNII